MEDGEEDFSDVVGEDDEGEQPEEGDEAGNGAEDAVEEKGGEFECGCADAVEDFHGNDGLGGKVRYSNQRVRKGIRLYLGIGCCVFDRDDMFSCPQMYRYVKIMSISQCEKRDCEGVGTDSKDTQPPDPCR